eukprot:TRINITY_DN3692_c1_g1_i1.p1 TRINITY_DN3692_c1_g1~~TRINITY_DN3692_c1_g1_i1.p1  ORF type:complete len:863 (-),score=103.50 TRINITY_DN3692_c1_g1_i1:474-3002(-)
MRNSSLTCLIVLLSFLISLAQLPSDNEWAEARKCGSSGKFLDFSARTTASWRLPACVAVCPPGSEALGAEPRPSCGEVPVCVQPQRPGAAVTQLRFVLKYFCQESSCRFRGHWRAFQQQVSVKVASLLGVPLTEVNSELMYWLQTASAGTGHKLEKFLIARTGEPDFPISGGRQLSEGGYSVRVAFRVASARISPEEQSVRLFEQSLPDDLLKYLGLHAAISDFDATFVPKPEQGVPQGEFAPVFQFGGMEPGELPRGAVLLGRRPECLDKCHKVNEQVNALGPGLCIDDCNCNGQRWCSHFGLCTGNTPSCLAPSLSDDDLTCSNGSVLTTATKTMSSVSTTTFSNALSSSLPRIRNAVPFPSIFELPGSCGKAVLDAVGPCALGDHGCAGTACAVVRAAANEAAQACAEAVCERADGSNSKLDWWEKQCSQEPALESLRMARVAGCAEVTTPLPFAQRHSGSGHDSGAYMEILLPCLVVVAILSGCVAAAWLFLNVHKCCRACCRFCPKSMRNRIGKSLSRTTGVVRSSSTLKGPPPETHWRAANGGLWWKGAPSSASCPHLDELSETGSEGTMPGPSLPQRSHTQPHMGRQEQHHDPPRHSQEKEKRPPRPRILSPPKGLHRPVSASHAPSQPPSTTHSTRPHSAQPQVSRPRTAPSGWETPSRRMAWEKASNEPENAADMSQRSSASSKSTTASSPRNDSGRCSCDSGDEARDGRDGSSQDGARCFAASGGPPPAARKRASPSRAPPKTPLQRPQTPSPSPPSLDVHSAPGIVQQLRQIRQTTPANERRKIFRDLQLRWHPDKNVGDEEHATEMFKILQDNRKWFLYDENTQRPPPMP